MSEHDLYDNCALEYFSTLYEMVSSFRCSGEEILQHNGFRNRAWVESLFEFAAENHCFANANCPQGLPFNAVRPLITQDMVALFCLAGDILEATFYEYSLLRQCQELSSMPQAPKATKQILKDLRMVRRKFCKRKTEYLNLAYGGAKAARKIAPTYDVCILSEEDEMQQAVLCTLEIMPIVFQRFARDENVTDLAPVNRLFRKYHRLFTICAEFEEA